MSKFINAAMIMFYYCLLIPCATAAEKPNIVFIMADDLGYGSVGCYGADTELVQTPAIDRLASEGVKFTDASTPSSICSPTRYGVLMGRYPWRSSLKYGVVNVGAPLLPDPNRMSIAKYLKQQGYRTAAIGKWHLGYGTKDHQQPKDWTKTLRPGPLELGFDYHFAVPQNHGDITGIYIENDHIYGLESDKVFPYSRSFYGAPYMGFDAPQRVNKNVMEELTDKAVQWLKQSSNDPFFLFFTPVAVHHPITPSDAMRGQSGCGPYGDFIQDIDLSLERILKTLDRMGVSDNTLVIFTSDNGGDIPPEAGRPERTAQTMGLDINGGLRGDKHTIWEGGTRVPFITRWPDKSPAAATSGSMINLIDAFATIVELIEGAPPSAKKIAPDSISFYNAMINPEEAKGASRSSMVTTNAQGIFSIRKDTWKYIEGRLPATWPQNKRAGDFDGQAIRQLYNLAKDRSEQKNVLESHQQIADQLAKELEIIRK
jgi:arylsulfatase A-like enzyme